MIQLRGSDGRCPSGLGVSFPSSKAMRGRGVAQPRGDIHHAERRYVAPLERDARKIARSVPGVQPVLLGSIASAKYVDVLARVFGDDLLFPVDFVGRGDMSRGGLLLRAARAGKELAYAPVLGTYRHGPRPPKLT